MSLYPLFDISTLVYPARLSSLLQSSKLNLYMWHGLWGWVVALCWSCQKSSPVHVQAGRSCPRNPAQRQARHVCVAHSLIKPDRWVMQWQVNPQQVNWEGLVLGWWLFVGLGVLSYLLYNKKCEQLVYNISKSILKWMSYYFVFKLLECSMKTSRHCSTGCSKGLLPFPMSYLWETGFSWCGTNKIKKSIKYSWSKAVTDFSKFSFQMFLF